MSEIRIRKEVRKFIRNSGLEVSSKMVCPIVKIFKMKYGEVDDRHISSIARKIINEY